MKSDWISEAFKAGFRFKDVPKPAGCRQTPHNTQLEFDPSRHTKVGNIANTTLSL